MLNFFDVPNMFHASIWVNYIVYHSLVSMLDEKHVWHIKKI